MHANGRANFRLLSISTRIANLNTFATSGTIRSSENKNINLNITNDDSPSKINVMVRGMGFEPMQPYGNRSLKAQPIPIQIFFSFLSGVLLSLSPLAKLGHPRLVGKLQS